MTSRNNGEMSIAMENRGATLCNAVGLLPPKLIFLRMGCISEESYLTTTSRLLESSFLSSRAATKTYLTHVTA